MYKEIKILLEDFVRETESRRTELSEDHDIPSVRKPTFVDFLEWLNIESS